MRFPSAEKLLLLALVSCTGRSGRAATERSATTLTAGTVAMVGAMPIAESSVLAVSRAQNLSLEDALDREVRDALLASGASARGYDEAPAVRAAVRGRLSRALLRDLYGAVGQTEPTDDEVARATARHFVEFDRPPSFHVIHAVVRVSDGAPASERVRARSLAERIAERVAKAESADEFREAVGAVGDRGDLQVVVELLKPVAADGRVVDVERPMSPPEQYAAPFARAASRLSEPGQKSGVVATGFGFHVLMLLDRSAAQVVPLEERRVALRAEILSERAKQRRAELLTELRAASAPAVERSAAVLLGTLDLDTRDDEAR